ncbi:hypothetical protein GUI51_13655 [Enterococcus mundtii]|uniref:Uncharacterized protein n=1 Tax=Enterococcus mundtii TaxID=53346 RepID=A0ABQ0VGZ5_ENTMU|nr:hypothetical protein [Enterococcus mundtii]MZU11475.1 hypothetical protein [Bifidobacterium longum]GEN18548.1 hypothetical protein LAC02_18290 [Ligilactobacillus acidipiscis]AUB54493.1 hypothetical protein EM4838_15885 [Enterococcus mundtii]MDB7088108.1 hypothetical protein [Enterococcus mundtii]MZZ60029.1 hypothetical protein [Enterococcus mundtii]
MRDTVTIQIETETNQQMKDELNKFYGGISKEYTRKKNYTVQITNSNNQRAVYIHSLNSEVK